MTLFMWKFLSIEIQGSFAPFGTLFLGNAFKGTKGSFRLTTFPSEPIKGAALGTKGPDKAALG